MTELPLIEVEDLRIDLDVGTGQVAAAFAIMSTGRIHGCRVLRHIGAWLIDAANRPGAMPVSTPTKPGHVTL